MQGRELKRSEKRKIKESVRKKCANYDSEYGCVPLDTDCYMCTIGFTNSSLCHYYEKCILPTEEELQNLFQKENNVFKKCGICGNSFKANGNKKYCSEECKRKAEKKAAAERKRRERKKMENNS